jgi:DNA (cytosine-5)-methyltransferase 1
MKVVELFAGIGGFRIACDELGIKTVWANDIDAKASKVYRSNFGDKEHVEGDVEKYIDEIPKHDLLTGGFPCQPFSSAGKKLGLEDSRGTLFEKIVYVLSKNKPKYFVLENVKRLLSMDKGAHFATILDALSSLGYFVEWRLLNAINFGLPQNRERIVIIGHLVQTPRSYLCTEEDLSELSDKQLSNIAHFNRWKKIKNHTAKFSTWGVALNGKFCEAKIEGFSEKGADVKLKSILEKGPDKKFFFTQDTIERIKNSDEVNRFFNGVEILYNQKGGARMGYSIFGIAGVAPTLTCTTSRHYERYKIDQEFRRLTNIEYARIQGFPDEHCQSATRYDQYPLFGNAVPPQLVKWVIDRAINGKYIDLETSKIQQQELL